jgi:hypothetical protein
MKIMYCRAVKNFIEKKRIGKIDDYNSHNKGFHEAIQGSE